jgi:hypothetical protein
MNGSVITQEATVASELADLRERVRALEIRLDGIERGAVTAVPPIGLEAATIARPASPVIDTEIAAATIFTRVAMLCFVLLGALILRVLTQQNILGARFGTILGFVYAGYLIVLSITPGRFGGFARENSVFQCSGAVLAFFIAIESALGTHTMGRVSAMITIAGFGLLALGMGTHQRKPALAGTGIIGGILALVALDTKEHTVALQLELVTLLAAAGIANSWRERWQWLRPLVTSMLLVLLPAGFFFCGKEPGVASGLLAASGAVWLVVMLQHLIVFGRLGRAAAWLPILTLWFAGIQQVAHWPAMGVATGGIAIFALGCVIVCARRAPEATAGLVGMMATAAFAGAIGWPMLDHTGLLCAIGGIVLWFAGRRAEPDQAAVFATLLMVAAAAAGLAQLFRPPVAGSGLMAMGLSAGILVFQYVRNGRTGAETYAGLPMRLAPIALTVGLALLLGLFWELLNRVFDQPAQLLLAQTVVVVLTSLGLTFWGHVAHRRSALFCGLACMVLALTKVLLVDLVRLKSVYMLTSLVLVGLASVAVSVILRRRA